MLSLAGRHPIEATFVSAYADRRDRIRSVSPLRSRIVRDGLIFGSFREVFQTELEEIEERRRHAGLTVQPKGNTPSADSLDSSGKTNGRSRDHSDPDHCLRNRSGLAFSGGGVRSASLNLGFLQALYRRGALRQFDYLSTVSGGGYIAAFFASLVCHPKSAVDLSKDDPTNRRGDGGPRPGRETEEALEPGHANGVNGHHHRNGRGGIKPCLDGRERDRSYDFLPTKTGQQPAAIRRMIHGGMYLRRPMLFLNRYLFGIFAINAMILCALASVAALAAYAFRFWDDEAPLNLTTVALTAGFRGDVRRAFLWPCLLALLWCTAWLARVVAEFFANRMAIAPDDRRFVYALSLVTKLLCWMTLLSLPMAVITLLATDDVSFSGGPIAEPSEGVVSRISGSLSLVLLAGQVLAMLPALKFGTLLRSGTDPHNLVEKFVFQVAGAALVFGVPLTLFWIFVTEDISGLVKYRDEIRPDIGLLDYHAPQLLNPKDIGDWPGFWRKMEAQARAAEAQTRPTGGEPEIKRLYRPAEAMIRAANTPLPSVDVATGRRTPTPPDHGLGVRAPVEAIRPVPTAMAGPLLEASVLASLEAGELLDTTYLYERFRRFGEIRSKVVEDREKQKDVIRRVNRFALSDPAFFRNFEAFDREDDVNVRPEGILPVGASPVAIVDFRDRGRGLWHDFEQLRKRSFPSFTTASALIEEARGWKPEELDALPYGHEKVRLWRLIREIQLNNRRMLQAYAGRDIGPERTVYAFVVHGRDQRMRLRYAAAFGTVFLVLAVTISLNSTSAHAAYRESLAAMWIVPRGRNEGETRLADLDTAEQGAPYLLINATAYLPRRIGLRPRQPSSTTASRKDSGGRTPQGGLPDLRTSFVRFLLTSRHCGSERTGYVNTNRADTYKNLALADAVTLSGAALTPEVTGNFLLRALMTMSNLRLGQRLPNPATFDPDRRRAGLPRYLWFPTFLGTLLDRLWEPEDRSFVMLSDGGLYENLGVEALLRRRTRVIVAVDAGQDGKGHFDDLFKLIRRCRAMYGIRIYTVASDRDLIERGKAFSETISNRCLLDDDVRTLRNLVSLNQGDDHGKKDGKAGAEKKDARRDGGDRHADGDDPKLAEQHFLIARIEYPPVREMFGEGVPDDIGPFPPTDGSKDADGYLIYIKPNFTGDEEADLAGYRRTNGEFPHDPTMDQFYDQRRFESYRQLGEHIGQCIADLLYAPFPETCLPQEAELWLPNWPPRFEEGPLGSANKANADTNSQSKEEPTPTDTAPLPEDDPLDPVDCSPFEETSVSRASAAPGMGPIGNIIDALAVQAAAEPEVGSGSVAEMSSGSESLLNGLDEMLRSISSKKTRNCLNELVLALVESEDSDLLTARSDAFARSLTGNTDAVLACLRRLRDRVEAYSRAAYFLDRAMKAAQSKSDAPRKPK